MELYQIELKIINIVAEEFQIEPDKVREASSLHELGTDSLGMLSIIDEVETEFGVNFHDEDHQLMSSLNDIVALVSKRLEHAE